MLRPWLHWNEVVQANSGSERLGRVTVGKISMWSRPSANSTEVGVLYEDAIIPWLREVIGEAPGLTLNRRWVETPGGYVYAPRIQPVRNDINTPVTTLPETALGRGMWAEVSVPYVPITLHNPPARGAWLREARTPRLYYSQLFWIDDIRTTESGQVEYRVTQKWGWGDILWAPAEGFRPLTEEELQPISPSVEDKKVLIRLNPQMMSCYEGNSEVYACRISSGTKYDAEGNPTDKWSTPPGARRLWRKLISHHMSGGAIGYGWDLPGIAWTVLFAGTGEAIHSTFWHNDFGTPRSRGCVNATPEDAKWVFRWTEPFVAYDVADITVPYPGGTVVEVVE